MLRSSLYFLILSVLAVPLMALQVADWEPFAPIEYQNHIGRYPAHLNNDPRRALLWRDAVWIATSNGDLWAVDERAGTADLTAIPGVVLDICRQADALRVMATADAGSDDWTLFALSPDGREGEHKALRTRDEGLAGLACRDDGVFAVTSRRLIWLGDDGARWERRLSERVPTVDNNTLLERDADLLLGSDIGEWGGGLMSIAKASGRVTRIEKTPYRNSCEGLIDTACTPVRGLTSLPWRSECVGALSGRAFSAEGNMVLEVCGTEVRQRWPSFCEARKGTWNDAWHRPCMSDSIAKIGDRLLVTGTHEPQWLDQSGFSPATPLRDATLIVPFRIIFDEDVIAISRSRQPKVGDLLILERR